MTYLVSHVHVKARDCKKTADWYVQAFNFRIVSDEVRIFGDRFIVCQPEGEGKVQVMFSEERAGETLKPGSPEPRFGLEHFGIDSVDIGGDIKRLTGMGAQIAEGPINMPNGNIVYFINTPGDVRIELIQRARKS